MDEEGRKMRKGLWSPDEDEKLSSCIAMYRKGSWSDIAKRAGLQRCGKSCRRRWMNHLRPGLKRGRFSPLEIKFVVELHRTLGNRWSEIAGHLVGRTDNDVKNLWNTQIKRNINKLSLQQPQYININNTNKLCSVIQRQKKDDKCKLITLQSNSDNTSGIVVDIATNGVSSAVASGPAERTPMNISSSCSSELRTPKVLVEAADYNFNMKVSAINQKENSKDNVVMTAPLPLPLPPEMITSVASASNRTLESHDSCYYYNIGPMKNPVMICPHTFDYSTGAPPYTETDINFPLTISKEYFLEDWFLPLLNDDVVTSNYNGPTFMPLV